MRLVPPTVAQGGLIRTYLVKTLMQLLSMYISASELLSQLALNHTQCLWATMGIAGELLDRSHSQKLHPEAIPRRFT